MQTLAAQQSAAAVLHSACSSSSSSSTSSTGESLLTDDDWRRRLCAAAVMRSFKKGKGSPYSITERRVPELIPAGSWQTVSHKPDGRLPLLSARPAVTPTTLQQGCYQFCCLVNRGTMGVYSLPKTVTRQRRDCDDLNPGPSAPESSTLTTRLPSHPMRSLPHKKTIRCDPLQPSLVVNRDRFSM